MSDTVDLIVVGVEGDIPRADLSSKLVNKFNQEAFTFEVLLDGAYGESAPYVAQSGVERGLAEGGKEQLESLGLVCTILPTGEKPEPIVPPPQISALTAAVDNIASDSVVEIDSDTADAALASFKSEEGNIEEASAVKPDEVSFDLDEELVTGDSALASFKKDTGKASKPKSSEVDFSDDLDAVGVDTETLGLADAKNSKSNISDVDDSLNTDFSDQIEDVGADKIPTGLAEAQKSKPNFNADVEEVDFSDDVVSIGIHEDDSVTPAVSKSKLEEEAAERNLNSFPKEDSDQETVDFSDELEILSSDAVPVASSEGVKNKADVPEALAEVAGDDLEAELIDPAPAEKEDKEPVDIDDGGLSLSTDNDAPLTTPREKSDTNASDDGGLSLLEDASAPLTAPKKKSDPDAADDGGLNLASDEASEKADVASDDMVAAEQSAAAAEPAPEVQVEAVADPISEVQSAAVEEPSSEVQPAASSGPAPEVKPVASASKVQPAAAEPPVAAPPTAAPLEPQDSSTIAAQVVTSSEAKINSNNGEAGGVAATGGLVLPGQLSRSVVPEIVKEDDLDDANSSATASLREAMPATERVDIGQADAADVVNDAIDKAQAPAGKKSKKKLVAALAGVAILGGAGAFAFMNAGSIAPSVPSLNAGAGETSVKDATRVVEKMKFEVAKLKPGADLENLSTGELLVNLSNNQSNGIVDLEPYFLESGDQVKRGPRIGAAIPAESEWMIRNRQPHPADSYFDEWSNRDADLSLFLALLDSLIEKGDLEVAQQLSDRAKDKLFSVMSTQRLARAYSDVGDNTKVTRLMSLASRDTYAIKAPEERVLALSDYAFTEQAIGLNEDAMDTFLKTSILARSLVKPERRAVGLSSAAIYFHRSGRTKQAQELLEQSLQAGNELPKNTAAKDLAIRYIALSEGRMGLFNQALEHTKLIVDPIATVSAYHGIALAIESTGDDTNARKVLNMAYRAGSQIEDPDERSNLLSKVVLASETE